MTQVYVIRTGQTTWDDQHRMESAAGAPLTDQGVVEVQEAAKELDGRAIKAVHACLAAEAERQTAEMVAKALRVKVCDSELLHELDYGLWQGLPVDEVKRRHPRLYRQWAKCPASVRPPEGETPAEAQQRLRDALKDITKRHKEGSALLVLRPVVAGLMACLVAHEDVDSLWGTVGAAGRWVCYEMDRKSL